jgi:hypothetical protein
MPDAHARMDSLLMEANKLEREQMEGYFSDPQPKKIP